MQFNSSKGKKKIELQKIIVYIAIIVAFLVFSITLGDAGFLSVNNQINILRQMTTIGIMSFGMTFVIGCGEIDLTVGANIATSGLVAAIVMRAGGNWVIALIAALATGLLIGLINGVILVVTGLPSFLITIGTLTILNGVSMELANSNSIPIYDRTFTQVFGNGKVFGIPGDDSLVSVDYGYCLHFIAEAAFRKPGIGCRGQSAGGEIYRNQCFEN